MRLDPHLDRLLDVVVEAVVDRLFAAEVVRATPETETPEQPSLCSGVVASRHGDVGGLDDELYARAATAATKRSR